MKIAFDVDVMANQSGISQSAEGNRRRNFFVYRCLSLVWTDRRTASARGSQLETYYPNRGQYGRAGYQYGIFRRPESTRNLQRYVLPLDGRITADYRARRSARRNSVSPV